MQYRKLGSSDIDISLIGLGTMTWGMQNTEKEAFLQMDYATSKGVNFFDTAEMYPIPPRKETQAETERIIGKWLLEAGQRDKIVLATKMAGPGISWIRQGETYSPQSLVTAVEDSLKRLQTDYIDLYQFHWPNRPFYHFQRQFLDLPTFDPKEEVQKIVSLMTAMGELIKEGKIRHFGLSNETAWGLLTYINKSMQLDLPRPVSIQNEYSLLCRIFELDLKEVAIAEECPLLAWSPLARGILSGKYLGNQQPAGCRLTLDDRKERRATAQCEAATTAYVNLALEHDLDPCQMALSFVNSRPFVASTLIGATSLLQLKANIDSVNIQLSDEVIKGIAEIRRLFPIPF